MSQNYFTTKKITLIAILGGIQYVAFTSMSLVMYLEVITTVTVTFAMVFERRDSFVASLVFGSIYLLTMGPTPWGLMYFIIYPCYSLLIGTLKPVLQRHFLLLCFITGLLSFMTGQLLQLPFIIFSKEVTLLYMIMGLRVSLIQFVLSSCFIFLTYKKISGALFYLKRKLFPQTRASKKTLSN